jgi:hypothetical protein
MPNWCSNALVVRMGVESFRNEALPFSFGKLVPLPQDLASVRLGRREIEGVGEVDAWVQTPEGPRPVDVTALTEKYGASNWYDWAIRHWGTKWDVRPEEVRVDDRGEEVWVWFDTAWGPPLEWLAAVARRFPEWQGELAFAEGGVGAWGTAHFFDGLLAIEEGQGEFWADVDEPDNPEGWDDWEGPEVADDVAAHLENYGLHTGG